MIENKEQIKYQGVRYNCDASALNNYLRKRDGVVVFTQRGVDNYYATIDKAALLVQINADIDTDNYGQGAEATRIKLCAALNCLIDNFESAGYTIEFVSLGAITCDKSALDARAGKSTDRVAIDDLL